MDFPPTINTEELYPRMKQERNLKSSSLMCTQNPTVKGKLRFQCHYEERKRRAEFRRKKIIQRLKKNYSIDVEGLNEDVAREIIMKAEMMEREKRQREKRNIERMVTMISRLIEEQKYKSRGTKIYPHPCRKPVKNISKCSKEISDKKSEITTDIGEEGEKAEWKNEGSEDNKKATKKRSELKTKEDFPTEEQSKELQRCVDIRKAEETSQTALCAKVIRKPKSCISIERCLECTPRRVVFNDYEKGKIYLQDLRITNIGLETIHCRYLGIVVHTKNEDRFPIGVAVRDNVKLRPGLSCSTKIRLCSKEDTKELQCSVVYETRRQRNPLLHSWFFVPVVCVPVRAIIKVIPLKITFPSLTWCEATDPENMKLLRKTLKIENSGGKTCWCTISNTTIEPHSAENLVEIPGELGEAEDEVESIKFKPNEPERRKSQHESSTYGEEFDGEGYDLSTWRAEETAGLLVEEFFENIFAPFRFSTKYCIDIPPFSSVQTEVRFIPRYKGFHHEMYFIQFADCDNCKEQAIELIGDIKQIPLRPEPQMIDLKTCIANSGVYAGTFKLFNESKGPYSVVLKVPSSIKNHAQVYPRTATILPSNSSDFSVRIYPRVTLARDAPTYYNYNSQVLEFPIFIHPANVGSCKRDYIKIYIFALITDYCLELSPSFVNFGRVTTLETVRTELKLTNHSLSIQEYGFLNLPKGVRIEPNMGFGKILPKESITLYLLFSPGEDIIGCDDSKELHEFHIAVTSIAKHGGFREKMERDEASSKCTDMLWSEDHGSRFSFSDVKSYSDDHMQYIQPEDSEDSDVCEEESSVEGEETCQHENKIREFLRMDDDKISECSYFKRKISQTQGLQNLKSTESANRQEDYSEYGEFEDFTELKGICPSKTDLHIVHCRAVLVQPRCRISETVIQLPATSCSSFSLYRFRLECIKEEGDISCSCGFRRVVKCGEKQRFQCSFEFKYSCTHIKLEPESGFLKPGDSLPITVIHRPEFPADQLQEELRLSKGQTLTTDVEKENPQSVAVPKQSKGQLITPKYKIGGSASKHTIEDVISVGSFELENSDLFSGEKRLAKLINPFYVETKIQCVIKTKTCDNKTEKSEVHEMILICPAIKPNFIYLGNCKEIKFNKVFVGTRSKMLLKIQNISLERISPSATLLNPVGPFICSAGIRSVEVDPEHVWQQSLIYAPLEMKGIEKQFFEIYFKSTNILLAVSGQALEPEFKIIPNFACCRMEAKLGTVEELKLEMENLSAITMNVYISIEFKKEGPDLEMPLDKKQTPEGELNSKKEKQVQKDDAKDKKKSKNSGNERFQYWEEVPEGISSSVENFEDMNEESAEVFSLIGANDNNEIIIAPSARQQFKIQFKPTVDKSEKNFAIKYAFKLERVSKLKEILVIGKILGGK